jgi:hypothetical protein
MYYRKRFFPVEIVDLQLRRLERVLRRAAENPDCRLSALISEAD